MGSYIYGSTGPESVTQSESTVQSEPQSTIPTTPTSLPKDDNARKYLEEKGVIFDESGYKIPEGWTSTKGIDGIRLYNKDFRLMVTIIGDEWTVENK